MSEGWCDRLFVFSVVEDDGENVIIEVSEEDYQKDLAAGVDEDAILNRAVTNVSAEAFSLVIRS